MRLTSFLTLSFLTLSIFYLSSCESPASKAIVSYEKTVIIGDSLGSVLEVVDSTFGAVQGEFQWVLEQAQRMSVPDSTVMQTLQKLGNTLATQNSALAQVEEKLDYFDEIELSDIEPDSLMVQVNIMKGDYSEMETTLSRTQEALLSVSGALENLRKRLNAL